MNFNKVKLVRIFETHFTTLKTKKMQMETVIKEQ